MNNSKKIILLLLTFSVAAKSFAQGNFERLGTQAFMKSDYRGAITQLVKAEASEAGNAKVLKMLGYSYFQCADYKSAISSYSKLIALTPSDYSAYYYRGKARLNIANTPEESLNQMRDSFYITAIKDFSKALELSGDEDPQILQNRGIAYKDYGIFKSFKAKKNVEKQACIATLNSAVGDFQKILTIQPLRKDIVSLIEYVKAQITTLK